MFSGPNSVHDREAWLFIDPEVASEETATSWILTQRIVTAFYMLQWFEVLVNSRVGTRWQKGLFVMSFCYPQQMSGLRVSNLNKNINEPVA